METITILPLMANRGKYTGVWIGLLSNEHKLSVRLYQEEIIEDIFTETTVMSFIQLWYIAMLYSKIKIDDIHSSLMLLSACKTTVLHKNNAQQHPLDVIERNLFAQFLPDGEKDIEYVFRSLPPIEYIQKSVLVCKEANILFNSLELRELLKKYESAAVSPEIYALIDSYEALIS